MEETCAAIPTRGTICNQRLYVGRLVDERDNGGGAADLTEHLFAVYYGWVGGIHEYEESGGGARSNESIECKTKVYTKTDGGKNCARYL